MNITLTERDFAEALDPLELERIKRPENIPVLGPQEDRAAVIDALPKVLSRRLQKMLPKGFVIREVEITVSLSGSPFGVGVDGEATVRFGRED